MAELPIDESVAAFMLDEAVVDFMLDVEAKSAERVPVRDSDPELKKGQKWGPKYTIQDIFAMYDDEPEVIRRPTIRVTEEEALARMQAFEP